MSSKFVNWLIFILLSFVWGSSFILMKEGMRVLTPYQVATIRILSAGIVMLPFARKAFKEVGLKRVPLVVLSGLLGSFFAAYLFCIAETKIDSSLAGILNALTPLFTIVIGLSFFKLKASARKIAGVVIGFIGLCLLLAPKGNIHGSNLEYTSLILLATILYGTNVNMVSRHLQGIASMHIVAVAFVFLIIPCLLILYATGFFALPMNDAKMLHSIVASSVLGIGGTAIASVLFYVLLKRAGALFASMVTYGIPFVAVFWGVLSGEVITTGQIISLTIILAGVYLANANKNPFAVFKTTKG